MKRLTDFNSRLLIFGYFTVCKRENIRITLEKYHLSFCRSDDIRISQAPINTIVGARKNLNYISGLRALFQGDSKILHLVKKSELNNKIINNYKARNDKRVIKVGIDRNKLGACN